MFTLREGLLAFTALAAIAAPAAAASAEAEAPRLLVDWRTRYEGYEAGGKDAEALTTRLRLGLETPARSGLSALVEVEAIGAPIDDYADGVRPRPQDAVIPDPQDVELNRAQVSWTPSPALTAVVGRQRLVFGNARFVGASGWRQNEQTFDAAKVVWTPARPVSLTYAYVDDVRRSVGRDHPQGVWRSDSHLLQADYAPGARWKASAYAFLLDVRNAPGQSSATTGLRLTGRTPLSETLSATWEGEYARQTDYAANPADFTVDYGLLAVGLAGPNWTLGAVVEQLGGDGTDSFQTPIATLHGFQGWADVIGATPPDGLRDVYLRGSRSFAAARPVKLTGELHDFRDDSGDHRIGREADAAVAVQLTRSMSVEAGAARFDSATPLYPDGTRGWLTLEFRR